MKKIVLGTANLNIKYGVFEYKHKRKYFNKKMIKELLKNNIKFIDTSPYYRLKNDKNNFENFEVITKIKLPKKNVKLFLDNLEDYVQIELKKNQKKSFYAILFHNPNDLYTKIGRTFLKKIYFLKKKKYFKKIGVSIYDSSELKKIFTIFNPEIVQFPINIFDQRMINDGSLDFLKKKKIITQARSIFLQGLLLKKQKYLSKRFNKNFYNKLDIFEKWCDNKQISRLDACVNFIKLTKNIDFVTIGFENLKQIKEVLAAFRKEIQFNYKELNIKDKNIIDPRKW
tara:strand:+ start:610 stop:1461 length:852 start_codon:yes stop_codon:yes gene_type:complete